MEESKGIGQIVAIVLIIVFSAISQLSKKKRKEAAQRNDTVPGNKIDSWWDEEVMPREEIPSRVKEYRFNGEEASSETKYLRNVKIEEVEKPNFPKISNKAAGLIENDDKANVEAADKNSMIRDFDLRKAIIYSEILRPKHKEI